MTRSPWLLLVNPSVPANSVKELIALAKARPGVLNFAGGGLGAGTHLLAVWFFQTTQIEAAYIPYASGGTAQSTIDTVAGRADATIVTYFSAEAFRQFIHTEVAHWWRLAKQAGIKLEQ